MQDNRSEMRRGAFMTVMVMAFSLGKLINIKFRRWKDINWKFTYRIEIGLMQLALCDCIMNFTEFQSTLKRKLF